MAKKIKVLWLCAILLIVLFTKKNFTQDAGPEEKSPQIPRNNLIDEHILDKIEKDKIPHAEVCRDEEFIRRVYLDLTGRIPKANAVKEFVQNTDPEKRDKLVDKLIGSPEYADRWTMWFGDLFRNTIYPLAVRGRNSLYDYIKDFVKKNKPYDRVVTELLTASGDNWSRGSVNWLVREGEMADMELVEDVYDNLAARVAQTFLGVRLMCISCHDGASHLEKVDLWLAERKREELWGMSAFFATMNTDAKLVKTDFRFKLSEGREEGYNADQEGGIRPKRSGDPPNPVYIFTGEAAESPTNPRRDLARMLTADPQFARATVNRLWAHFMVKGIVEPVDGFDLNRQDPDNPPPQPWSVQPSHPKLLEDLATEFINSGYNLQHIMKLICRSGTYQLSSKLDPKGWKAEYERYYARKLPRMLTSEEILDAIVTATEIPAFYPVSGFKKKVAWAMQLPGPDDPEYTDETGSAIEILNAFWRGDRGLEPRKMRARVLQPLSLMNSSFVDERVSTSKGILARLLKSKAKDQKIIEELFLAALSRWPSEQEKKMSMELLSKNRNEGLEDLLWSLINKTDFIHNY